MTVDAFVFNNEKNEFVLKSEKQSKEVCQNEMYCTKREMLGKVFHADRCENTMMENVL